MKLLFSPNSPYARKCRVTALEKGVMDKIELVEVSPAENPPELWAVNPLGTVPAMTTEGGMHLCESPVICKYIDSLSPQPQLMPDDLCVGAFVALADGIMDAAVAVVMEGRRPEGKKYDAWVERKEAAISRAI
ncbi:MAG: glutathione S-transferase, partial [Alphaproteobacteria bacterium]|nr:glutathione S-transferase [Alphaproteobacteria bacterium]